MRICWVYHQELDKSLDKATWIETSKNLASLGWEVELISRDKPDSETISVTDDNVKRVHLGGNNKYLLNQIVFHYRASKYIYANHELINFLLFENESAPFLAPLFFFKKIFRWRSPKFIMDTRTLPMDYKNPKEILRAVYMMLSIKLGYLYSDKQTFITNRMAEHCKVAPNRLLCCWPSGVDLSSFTPQHQRTEADKIRIIYCGNLAKKRALINICEAVVQLVNEGNNIEAIFVGKGELYNELAGYSIKYPRIISLIPPQPHEKIPYYLSLADFGILPFPSDIQFVTSSPIKLFEYLASGLGIIATKIPCHTDILSESAGFWAKSPSVEDLKLAIKEAYDNRDRLPEIAQNSRIGSFNHSWLKSAKTLSDSLINEAQFD